MPGTSRQRARSGWQGDLRRQAIRESSDVVTREGTSDIGEEIINGFGGVIEIEVSGFQNQRIDILSILGWFIRVLGPASQSARNRSTRFVRLRLNVLIRSCRERGR